MEIPFFKIQATGNDFVVMNFAAIPADFTSRSNIKRICNRQFGIGADGFIAVEKEQKYIFRFHYYNSDGSRGEMCANGCRAAMKFALEQQWIKLNTPFLFIADDGAHSGLAETQNIFSVSLNVAGEIETIPLES